MSLTFNLESIAADDTLTVSPTYPAVHDDAFDTTVNATAELDGATNVVATMIGCFHFKLDTTDVADADGAAAAVAGSDVAYSYTADSWPELAIGSSLVTGNPIQNIKDDDDSEGAPSLAADMVRHIAKEITGGFSSSDIFSNEKSLRTHVNDRDSNVQAAIEAILGVQSNIDIIGRHLMEKMLNDASRREDLFAEIAAKNDTANANGVGNVCNFPLKADDVFVFSVGYLPIKGAGVGGGDLTRRTYKIQLTLK